MKYLNIYLVAFFSLSPILPAASITVINYDFETGGLPDNSFSNNPGVIPTGWTAVGSGLSGSFYGYLNPEDSTYVGTTGLSATIGTMSGPNVFYFGSALSDQGIEQTLSANYLADTNYTLTVSIGTRLADEFQNNLQAQLLAGTTVIASDIFSPSIASSFVDHSLFHPATPGNASLYGQALTVRFLENGINNEVDIDNIRLTTSPIPEPSTGLFFFMSIATLALRRRR